MSFGKGKNDYGFGKKKKRNLFLKFVVAPLALLSLIVISTGIYSFIHANRIMRREPKPLEDFARNILPAFSAVSFNSLDGNTVLGGWFFPGGEPGAHTVVMVHENGKNRLQYGAGTIGIYEFFTENGFNVLSFDLRNSGNSGGKLSSFGYGEWEDVLGAVLYVKETIASPGVLLYGFKSGVTACLIAAEKLESRENGQEGISGLPFDSRYIKGFILDAPLASSSDYIRHYSIEEVFAGKIFGQHTIPFAIRLSAINEREHSLAAILARTQSPVHIISEEYADPFLFERSDLVVKERLRLFPNHTTVYKSSGHANGDPFLHDAGLYLSSIEDFLRVFFPKR